MNRPWNRFAIPDVLNAFGPVEAAMNAITKAANLAVLAAAMVVVLLISAQAKPSPYEPPQSRVARDIAALATTPFDVASERAYFQAPRPASAQRALPCTVDIVVFEKTRLAQACY